MFLESTVTFVIVSDSDENIRMAIKALEEECSKAYKKDVINRPIIKNLSTNNVSIYNSIF